MEFNTDVSKLQGALLSLGNRDLLNKPDSKETISVLKNVFQSASSRAKSQMTFLMILNSDLSILSQLENDENFCLFTKILPLIEKDVLVKLIFELNLQPYFFDVIKNCHSAFTNEIISVCLKNFKDPNFWKNEYDICHLYEFWAALFVKIHNIHEGFLKDYGLERLTFYFDELYDHLESIILTSFKSRIKNIHHFIGMHLYYFFNQILLFLLMVNNKNYEFKQDELYDFKFNFENDSNTVHSEKQPLVTVCKIFNNLHKIMNCITVDFWMELSDCFLNSDTKNSIQELIGHIIYQICEELNNLNPEFYSNIPPTTLQCLSSCKIKPKSEIELLCAQNISVIIENVDVGEKEREKWFKALLPHYISNYSLVIDCLMRNLNLADSDDVSLLLENTLKFLQAESDKSNLDHLKKIFFQVFKKIDSQTDVLFWMRKTLENVRPGLLKTETFNSKLTEIFNKVCNDEDNNQSDHVQKEIVCICLESPEETLMKICKTAISGNFNQVSCCLNILRILEYVCNTKDSPESNDLKFLEKVLLELIRGDNYSEKEENSFIFFLTELVKENILGFEFFEKILDSINLNLEKYDFEKVVFFLKLIESCKPYKLFNFNKSACLVFMSQILAHLSWNLETFHSIKPKGLQLCHHIISDIINELSTENDGIDLEWARQEILELDEIHQSYFCDLWFNFSRCWTGSRSFLSTLFLLLHASGDVNSVLFEQKSNLNIEEPSNNIKAFLLSNLVVVLPQLYDDCQWRKLDQVLTILLSEHWKTNTKNVNVLELFSSAMYLLAVELNKDKKIYDCFEFCLRNFERLKFFDRMTDDEFIDFIEKLIFPVQGIEDDGDRKNCSFYVMQVLIKFMDTVSRRKKIHLYEVKIKKLVKVLNVKEIEEAIDYRISGEKLNIVQY